MLNLWVFPEKSSHKNHNALNGGVGKVLINPVLVTSNENNTENKLELEKSPVHSISTLSI